MPTCQCANSISSNINPVRQAAHTAWLMKQPDIHAHLGQMQNRVRGGGGFRERTHEACSLVRLA